MSRYLFKAVRDMEECLTTYKTWSKEQCRHRLRSTARKLQLIGPALCKTDKAEDVKADVTPCPDMYLLLFAVHVYKRVQPKAGSLQQGNT